MGYEKLASHTLCIDDNADHNYSDHHCYLHQVVNMANEHLNAGVN